jgi:hypothetical protein
VLWAADVWYSIKKHWCLEAQRLVREERSRVPTQSASRPGESAKRDTPEVHLREASGMAQPVR